MRPASNRVSESFEEGRFSLGTSSSGVLYVEPRPAPRGVDLRFFTRRGGVSEAPFDSLNISKSVGDDAEAVERNLALTQEALGGVPSAWVKQVAGDRVVEVEDGGFAGEADGLITTSRDLSLVIGAADCAPVALVGKRAVGMVHSGWRGTLVGISGKAATRMERLESRAPVAYIGPCIRSCCYEVSEDLARTFAEEFGESVVSGRMLSIPEAIEIDLRRSGVEEIHDTGLCTGCRGDLFFSHRKQKPKTGRNLAAIVRSGEVA